MFYCFSVKVHGENEEEDENAPKKLYKQSVSIKSSLIFDKHICLPFQLVPWTFGPSTKWRTLTAVWETWKLPGTRVWPSARILCPFLPWTLWSITLQVGYMLCWASGLYSQREAEELRFMVYVNSIILMCTLLSGSVCHFGQEMVRLYHFWHTTLSFASVGNWMIMVEIIYKDLEVVYFFPIGIKVK